MAILVRLSQLRRLYHMFQAHMPLLQPTCWIPMFPENFLERMALTLTIVRSLQDLATLLSPLSLLVEATLVVMPHLLAVLARPD